MLPTLRLLTLYIIINLHSSYAYTWPDPVIDPIEDLYVQTDFSSAVNPCGSGGQFQVAAQWLRNAYHDMSTHDVTTKSGGIDASIGFEMDRPENVGSDFDVSLGFFNQFQTPTTSMSDLIALGAITAVRSCGTSDINIPLRVGRIDATQAGPPGVPTPTEDLATHTATFAKQGFNATEMIALVACGHTIGGVHPSDFPDITGAINPNDPLDTFHFDSTFTSFDNKIATEFVSNTTQNPLIVGPSASNSDSRIFNSDGGASMKAFANSNSLFISTCKSLLERMVNTVPGTVTLSDPIIPISVKPQNIVLQFNENQTLSLSGNIRLLFPNRDDTRTVILHTVQRSGTPGIAIGTTLVDGSQGSSFFGNISTYQFNQTISTSSGISSFSVEIRQKGTSSIFVNGGKGFPVLDAIAFEPQHSCLILGSSPGATRNFTVAVRDSSKLTALAMQWHSLKALDPSPSFQFTPNSAPLIKGAAIGNTGYTKYTAVATTNTFSDFTRGTYDVSATDTTGKHVTFTGSRMPFCFT